MTLLRLLQDICSVWGILPSSFVIGGVTRNERFSVGGEALIYRGVYKGTAVAVRECVMHGDKEWSSREGQRELRVSYYLSNDCFLFLEFLLIHGGDESEDSQ